MYLPFIPFIGFIGLPFNTVISLLGISLIILVVRAKITKISKAFFILTGASLIGACFGYILSNYVLVKFINRDASSMSGDLIFIVAFLVGMVGIIVLIVKKKVIIKE